MGEGEDGRGDARIRRATAADAAAVAELHQAVWCEVYRGVVPDAVLDDPAALPDRTATWTRRLATGTRSAAVASAPGTPGLVGAVSWVPAPAAGPVDELASLYVAAAHRGTGLARRLLDEAVGDRPAFLWVFEANPRARAFYRRCGFAGGGARRVDPGTGAVEVRLERVAEVPPTGTTPDQQVGGRRGARYWD